MKLACFNCIKIGNVGLSVNYLFQKPTWSSPTVVMENPDFLQFTQIGHYKCFGVDTESEWKQCLIQWQNVSIVTSKAFKILFRREKEPFAVNNYKTNWMILREGKIIFYWINYGEIDCKIHCESRAFKINDARHMESKIFYMTFHTGQL